jgi:hypothetical protein
MADKLETSPRPKLRPAYMSRKERGPDFVPSKEEQAGYEFSDTEFRADMDTILSKDPIARLGFDTNRMQYDVPEGTINAHYMQDYDPSKGEYYQEVAGGEMVLQPDTVHYGPDFGSSKDTIAHETRHRGFFMLRDMEAEDPEYFEKKYGKEAALMLDPDIFSDEFITEIFDNPDATYVEPKTGKTKSMEAYFTEIDPSHLRKLKKSGALSGGTTHPELVNKGMSGLRRAAEDILEKTKSSKPKEMAKGGTTMRDQMSMFEEGGLNEEGGMVDEESGNEVPNGSTRKEVRDDIPAMLSEGEFVFPADVVRYHGLEKLMELRQEAKMGMKKMEAMGQMGNADEATLPDDIPFTMDDLIIIGEPIEKEEPEEKAYGGVLHAAAGTFVAAQPQQQLSTGIIGNQQSMYAGPNAGMPNVNSNVGFTPASSVIAATPTIGVPTPIAPPATGYSPMYQPTPTPTVAPTFEAPASKFVDDVSDAYKKVKYINPATGDTMMIDEHLGNPVQAVPAGYIRYDDYIAGGGAETTDTGPTTVGTTQTIQQSDSSDRQRILELKDSADRERAQALYDAKQKDLAEGTADALVGRWLDNKRILGAGQTLFGVNPLIGAATSAAGYREQKQLEKALDDRYSGWREGKAKGLSPEMQKKLADYQEGGFFRNTKAFGNKIFDDVKTAATGFTSNFTKKGQTAYYTKYANDVTTKGAKYDVADNPLAGNNATGFVAVKNADGSLKMNTNDMPQSDGNLSIKEQQAYDNAVSNGDSSTADHYAVIASHRAGQDAYAAAVKNGDTALAEALGKNMSAASKAQAIKYGGSVLKASESGTAKKTNTSGTGIFSKYEPVEETSTTTPTTSSKDSSSDVGGGGLFGGYSCYVATALNNKGYWPTIKKIKLIKWCMDAKPEDKFDTKLWRNGYTVFGKTIIAPHVDNKIIQWLSDGFYDSRVKKKKDVKSLLGLLFFYIPSYTIALYKMLRNDLVDIERT